MTARRSKKKTRKKKYVVKKTIRLPPAKRKGKRTITLTPEDLGQFRVRRNACEAALLGAGMMKAGYELWTDEIAEAYGIKKPFNVDPQTGVLVPASTVS